MTFEKGFRPSGPRAITRPEDAGSFPASFAQQRLWFLDQLEPGNPAFNIWAAFRVRGDLQRTALEQSLDELVRRHEALRTTFTMVEGQPRQVIQTARKVSLPVVDLGEIAESEREGTAGRLATAEAGEPFDLSMGPLFRSKLLRLDEQDHVLLLTMHHIVSDGWSKGILFRELKELYEAFSQGRPSALPELPLQYADYAVWQRERVQGQVLESQLTYWKSQLQGIPPFLELPTDRPRPAVQTYRGGQRQLLLPKSLVQAIEAVGRREWATLFMTLFAAFEVLLWRYSGQEDLTVGTPIAGRTHVETEALIGCFVNTLVLRGDLSGDPTFRELLGRVREMALGAYEVQDLPFEKLVDELKPERNLSQTPLFQVMFMLQNAPTSPLELRGLSLSPMTRDYTSAMFDLTLLVTRTDEGLLVRLEHNSDLFEASTIDRMLGHLEVLLGGVVVDAGQRISRLPLLSEAERDRVLLEWNRTEVESQARCIHELIAEQSERTPEAVAMEFGGEALSYGELDRRTNQLARHLRGMGVGPEVPVGICVERSLEMVVGLLGVLKAGGAYVPLDPAYPKERLGFMLEDADVGVLLTQDRLVAGLPSHRASVLRLDTEWEKVGEESEAGLGPTAGPGHSAYVIYTSGSTGKPKGVVVTHRSVVNLLESMRQETGLGREDSLLAVTSLSFDIAGLELFLPLCVGARLVIADREVVLDGAALAEVLRRAGVTVMQGTPATWELLVRAGWGGQEGLKALCGGEALPQPLAESLLSRSGALWNLYGPTETTIWSAVRRVSGEDRQISIGGPIANTRIYILDRGLQPVPVGVPGELHIGGDGLARGYRNQPPLTAERFIPDPFGGTVGGRLYKTGDRARYRPDGSIEFLGRTDHQVKVRGFRIELSEIETVLRQHPGVREAVVLAREDLPGEKRLVAYLVPLQASTLAIAELRAFAREKLPGYMEPAVFVMLDELPLTSNGKLDRRALPAPEGSREGLAQGYVAPRNAVEEQIAEIWADALRVEPVGIHDNFFDLGGHSLVAIRVLSRLREVFFAGLPLRVLFEGPTVAELADRIVKLQGDTRGSLESFPIAPVPRGDRIPLSFSQQRLWFLFQMEPGDSSYNVPKALRITGPLQVEALQQALDALAARHESLRTTFDSLDGNPVQKIAPSWTVALPVVDLRGIPQTEREAEARRLAAEEARTPFDLARGPLLRTALLRLAENEHVWLLTMHHIVTDEWSSEVFSREVTELYEAFREGRPSRLPALPIQYADYAVWQHEWMRGIVPESQLGYWKEQLAGLPELKLPTDHPRPRVQTFSGARQFRELPDALAQDLKTLSRREGVTPFMTFLAAFQALLFHHTGQDDIIVGSPAANRDRVETQGLIGFFVNTVLLRSKLAGDPTFRELLDRVRETVLEAHAHQDLPFDKLVTALQPKRDLSRLPLFQVWFVLNTGGTRRLQLPGVTVTSLKSSAQKARYDLELVMSDNPQGLKASIEYSTALFDAATIDRLLKHYEVLLASLVAQPTVRLSGLSAMLGESDQQQEGIRQRELQEADLQKLTTVKRRAVRR